MNVHKVILINWATLKYLAPNCLPVVKEIWFITYRKIVDINIALGTMPLDSLGSGLLLGAETVQSCGLRYTKAAGHNNSDLGIIRDRQCHRLINYRTHSPECRYYSRPRSNCRASGIHQILPNQLLCDCKEIKPAQVNKQVNCYTLIHHHCC